jgi:hypothetical protein
LGHLLNRRVFRYPPEGLVLFVPNQIAELITFLRKIATGDDDRTAGIIFAAVAVILLAKRDNGLAPPI